MRSSTAASNLALRGGHGRHGAHLTAARIPRWASDLRQRCAVQRKQHVGFKRMTMDAFLAPKGNSSGWLWSSLRSSGSFIPQRQILHCHSNSPFLNPPRRRYRLQTKPQHAASSGLRPLARSGSRARAQHGVHHPPAKTWMSCVWASVSAFGGAHYCYGYRHCYCEPLKT